jgi:phosphonatase-like hydrolase
VSLVCCGLLGTTADDGGMLERAFAEACATQGIVPGTAAYAHCMVGVHQSRGQSAVDVFRGLFSEGQGRAEAAALSFERSFRAAVDRTGLSPAPGAEEAIGALHDAGVRVCLITGLSRRLLSLALDTLGWWRLVDLALSPEDVPRGCPWPDLMLSAMLRLGVEDVRETAFAGSTSSGVLTGKRAGAGVVAGVLTGGHTGDRLRAAGATHLIDGMADLPALLLGSAAPPPPASGAPTATPAASAPQVPLERRNSGL